MAIAGRKRTPTHLKLVQGNPGKRPILAGEPMPPGRPRSPLPLTGRPRALWAAFIRPAWWLSGADSPKAWLWVQLQAEAEQGVAAMTAARLAQLRALGSELGFDPASRARLGTSKAPDKADTTARFFK